MVADRDRGDARPDLADDAGALMAEDRRKDPLRILALERVGVGMADAGRHDLDQRFARLRPVEIDLVDLQRRVRRDGDGGAGLHETMLPPIAEPRTTPRVIPAKAGVTQESRNRLIHTPTRSLSLGASNEAIAASGSGARS